MYFLNLIVTRNCGNPDVIYIQNLRPLKNANEPNRLLMAKATHQWRNAKAVRLTSCRFIEHNRPAPIYYFAQNCFFYSRLIFAFTTIRLIFLIFLIDQLFQMNVFLWTIKNVRARKIFQIRNASTDCFWETAPLFFCSKCCLDTNKPTALK